MTHGQILHALYCAYSGGNAKWESLSDFHKGHYELCATGLIDVASEELRKSHREEVVEFVRVIKSIRESADDGNAWSPVSGDQYKEITDEIDAFLNKKGIS